MIDVLGEAASPETLRDLLPITYSALLDGDQVVRAAGIDLWVACAGVADTLPGELIELSEALLQDRYVIVHRRMLRQRLGRASRSRWLWPGLRRAPRAGRSWPPACCRAYPGYGACQ